ncbi:MAG TPA: two-component sensor histidine kinase [Ruminococcaceae bacterium]|nr:two-component sensor histidine kinase [Oscillospiraceae bacterium]
MRFVSQKELLSQWDAFKVSTQENPVIIPNTFRAWKRCLDSGLKPEKLEFAQLNDYDLENKLISNASLIEIARPYMHHLDSSLSGVPHVVFLSDKDGWVLDIYGDVNGFGGKNFGICRGANWAEDKVGNNGIGTPLATGAPVFVYGKEHFGTNYGSSSCFGVPIKHNGQVIGSIDIGVPNKYAYPARLHFAVDCVHSIETTFASITFDDLYGSNRHATSAAANLIASTIHDIKNPLAVIRGLSELGKTTSMGDRLSSYFDKIIEQTDYINSTVVDLLSTFSKIKLSPKSVVPVIEQVLQALEPICEARKTTLSLLVNGNENVNLCETLFRRAIENLIINAVQAIDRYGHIAVKVQSIGKYMMISIKDTAGGIPEQLRNCLFHAFTQKKSGGTGLGLYMVYQTITDAHSGQIWFETNSGVGTTFFIKLPIANQD